jgi:predicted PurR-regulated permease PerM
MSTGAVWALAVIVLINTVFIAGIAIALFVLNKKLEQLTEMAHPLAERANATLQKVEALTAQLGERVNKILDETGHVVENVTQKVETTTSMAEETIAQPLIGAASVMAGISRGWDTYKAQAAKEKGDTGE